MAMTRLRYQAGSSTRWHHGYDGRRADRNPRGRGACWVIAIDQMHGMDMGVATRLGSFGFFAASWASMMAAMMPPGAVPALLRAHASGRLLAAPELPVRPRRDGANSITTSMSPSTPRWRRWSTTTRTRPSSKRPTSPGASGPVSSPA